MPVVPEAAKEGGMRFAFPPYGYWWKRVGVLGKGRKRKIGETRTGKMPVAPAMNTSYQLSVISY
jgi:hypothetical protein